MKTDHDAVDSGSEPDRVPEPAEIPTGSAATSGETEGVDVDSGAPEKAAPPDDAEPATGKAEPSGEDAEPAAEKAEPAAAEPAANGSAADEPAAEEAEAGAATSRGRSRKLVAAVVVVAVLVLAGLGAGGYWWFAVRLPEGVAFRADGVELTEEQLEEQVRTLGALYGVQPPTEPERLDTFRRDVAKSTAVAMVIDNAAAERKVVVADRQVSDFLARYMTQFYGEGQAGRDAYIKDLADKGTSEPKVLAELKRQMTVKQLFNQVTSTVTVTDQDVRAAFDQRPNDFGIPERREIHNIVVASKPEADAVLAEVSAPGANFEAVAAARSMDASTKDAGGNLGLVAARDLEPGYAGPAFSTPVGGVFGPIPTERQTAAGLAAIYNVGKVVQSQPAAPADFEKVKDAVRQVVFTERADAAWRAFLSEQISGADVQYADKYRPADPDALPSARDQAAQAAQSAPGQPAPAPAAPGQPAPAPAPAAPGQPPR